MTQNIFQMKNEKKDTTENIDMSIYIDALSKKFKPALSPSDTTHWFSTEEVRMAILEIDPSVKVNNQNIFDALHQAGYDFTSQPGSYGLHFKWMFKAKD